MMMDQSVGRSSTTSSSTKTVDGMTNRTVPRVKMHSTTQTLTETALSTTRSSNIGFPPWETMTTQKRCSSAMMVMRRYLWIG